MSIDELKSKVESLGRDFASHKIFFFQILEPSLLAGNVFSSPKLAGLVKRLETMPYIQDKLEFCVELVRWIALKRDTITDDYLEDLRLAVQCATLYYFNFLTNSPTRGILKVYQEEIAKGNYLVLVMDKEKFEESILPLFAIFLVERLKEIMNASTYYLKNKKEKLKEFIESNYSYMSYDYRILLFNFLKIFEEKITVKIIDKKEEILASEFFLKSLIENYNNTIKILKMIDKDEWFKKIVIKYTRLFKNLLIKEKEKILREHTLMEEPQDNTLIEEIIGKETELFILNRSEEIRHNLILPSAFASFNEAEIESYIFVCEECLELGHLPYCEKCKREKRMTYFCETCGIANITEECISCGNKISSTKRIKLNIEKLIPRLDLFDKKDFRGIKFLEAPFKAGLRLKHDVLIAENGVAELEIKVSDATHFIYGSERLELKENEIIIPSSIAIKFSNVSNYLKEELEYYSLKIKVPDTINEGDLLLIRRKSGIIYYPVKVKKIVENIKEAVINPLLYNLLFGSELRCNIAELCLPLDVLLNASALLFDEEKAAYIITKIKNEGKTEYKEYKLGRIPNDILLLNIRIKHQLLLAIANAIREEINMKIKCNRCETTLPRITLALRCYRCGSKLLYRLSRSKVRPLVKDFDSIMQNEPSISRSYKRSSRRLKKYILDYLKEEDRSMRLDKFFS